MKKKEKWAKTQDNSATSELEAQQYKTFYKHNNVKFSRYKQCDSGASENKKSSAQNKKSAKDMALRESNNSI